MLDVNSYELINKCSPFVLFNFIRIVGGNKTTLRATTRHTTANGEEWRHPTSGNHTTETVKECNDNNTKV